MWVLDRLEEKIGTVDVEVGLVPFTTNFGPLKSDVEIGISGVVTDIVNKDDLHKLQIEENTKEKIAKAFAKRDLLILLELKKIPQKSVSVIAQFNLPKEIYKIEDLRKRKIIAEHFTKLASRCFFCPLVFYYHVSKILIKPISA
jgi:hypothetical protein